MYLPAFPGERLQLDLEPLALILSLRISHLLLRSTQMPKGTVS
jgi:hypothetical protein